MSDVIRNEMLARRFTDEGIRDLNEVCEQLKNPPDLTIELEFAFFKTNRAIESFRRARRELTRDLGPAHVEDSQFGSEILRARKERGLTQKVVSERFNRIAEAHGSKETLAPSSLCAYERGQYLPENPDRVKFLHEALGIGAGPGDQVENQRLH